MRQLDTHLGTIDGQQGAAVFSDWFAQHRADVAGFKQRRFRDVLSNVDPWRARPLARGPASPRSSPA